MSASLVGSEMCIRDRSSLRGSESERISGSLTFPRRARARARRLRRPDPVSYTHLTLPTICSV
eukprot:10326663-Alexandrium_andersonii.AAC.1